MLRKVVSSEDGTASLADIEDFMLVVKPELLKVMEIKKID